MPRETIYGQQHPVFEPGDPHPMVPVVDVMWSREAEYVQVVTKATDAHGGRWAGPLPSESESESPAVTVGRDEVVIEAQPVETHFTDGMHVDLDRKGINDLIRKLRRARDQAFGRDE
jgi:hypothetical protein